MRKGKRNDALVRTTIFMTDPLAFYLDAFALQTRRSKSEIIREALRKYLHDQGFKNLDRLPRSINLHLRPEP